MPLVVIIKWPRRRRDPPLFSLAAPRGASFRRDTLNNRLVFFCFCFCFGQVVFLGVPRLVGFTLFLTFFFFYLFPGKMATTKLGCLPEEALTEKTNVTTLVEPRIDRAALLFQPRQLC